MGDGDLAYHEPYILKYPSLKKKNHPPHYPKQGHSMSYQV